MLTADISEKGIDRVYALDGPRLFHFLQATQLEAFIFPKPCRRESIMRAQPIEVGRDENSTPSGTAGAHLRTSKPTSAPTGLI